MAMEPVSASALERFGYCPLSWWLALRSDVTSKQLEEGDKEHSAVANDLVEIVEKERTARGWERIVLAFSVVATVLALIGITLMSEGNGQQLSVVLGALSIVWIVAALLFLFRSASVKDKKERSRAQQIVAGFAIVAMVIALNAVSILNVNPDLAFVVEVIALLWLMAASLALYVSIRSVRMAREIREKRDIQGEIKYVDDGKPRMLRSERLGLQGRPDYVLEIEGEMVPVEIKSGRTPKGPLFSHILQVAAYCVLLEEEGQKVTHGILRYDEAEHEIEYNQDLRRMVLSKLEEMRVLMRSGDVHRNHHRPGKCRSCSRREGCPERLA
ncbi:MAG: CRISPR-associated protein Cas4 [Methanomassiliicoccales archaeon]|nr:CRISPR-associated protein Cas4 [Methanomassiliicoccales archaeon]